MTDFVEMIHEGVHESAARGSVLQLLWRIPDYCADITVLACPQPTPLTEASSLLTTHSCI